MLPYKLSFFQGLTSPKASKTDFPSESAFEIFIKSSEMLGSILEFPLTHPINKTKTKTPINLLILIIPL